MKMTILVFPLQQRQPQTSLHTKGRKWETEKEGGSPALPSLHCSSAESPPAALASAGGFSQASPLPGPPWCAPRCASLWVCGHVCARWASSLSRPAWQQAFTPALAWGCTKEKKVCVVEVCVRVWIEQQHTPLLRVTLHLYFPSCWNSFHSSCLCSRFTKPLPSVWECVRGRGSMLCLSSRFSSVALAAPPPSLPHSLTSVGGLTRSVD